MVSPEFVRVDRPEKREAPVDKGRHEFFVQIADQEQENCPLGGRKTP